MVLYFVKNYIYDGKVPQDMVDNNTCINYAKLEMLIRNDKEFTHITSIVQTLMAQGYITSEIMNSFSVVKVTDPVNFISLLYYLGVLTICGIHQGRTKLTITNLSVKEQLNAYLQSR